MLSPEIVAEQVMGYVIGAAEMIPTLQPKPQSHSVAILPQGPHFYTGLLQAAGYLLLDSKKKKLLVISQQYDDLTHILLDRYNYGPIFGQTRNRTDTSLQGLARQFKAKISGPDQKDIYENMGFQLPFIRIITEIEEYVHIGIGPKTPQTITKNLIDWIKKHITEYNIVLLTNIELQSSTPSKKKDEQNEIAEIVINKASKSSTMVTLFKQISKITRQEPEIVAYVNPGDFGVKGSLTTRYVCAVG